MKILPLGAKLFYADGLVDDPTHTTKLTVVFRNFANAPQDYSVTIYPSIHLYTAVGASRYIHSYQ